MMIKKTPFLLAMSLCFANYAAAYGIQYVNYNRDKIPSIVTAAGIATEIIFEDDETIEYSTFGFSSAWESQVVRNHILVFKAKDPEPETNLIVHTNKRDYLFTVISGNNEWKRDPNNAHAVYSMRMLYHDSQSKAALAAKSAAEKAEKAQAESERILRNRDISQWATNLHTNYDYRATAYADDIIPQRMWDNGTLSFIYFKPGTKRGVVYELDHNQKAHLVNQHTEKNGLLVIHGVYPHLIIRLGDEAVEIRRNTQGGKIENNHKTTVPGTVRTISDNAPTAYGISATQNQNAPLSTRRLSLIAQPVQPPQTSSTQPIAQPEPAASTSSPMPTAPEVITITAEPNEPYTK